MVSTIIDNNTSPLLENALAMLKPGGYLQWDENDPTSMRCNLPHEEAKADAAETLVQLQTMMMRAQGKILPDWLYSLDDTLRAKGCEVLVSEVIEAKKELSRAMTDNYLLVWRGERAIQMRAT